jgi:hypothetical protein
MPTNIIDDIKSSLANRNLLNLEEAALLTRLSDKFDKKQGELTDKEDTAVWNLLNRLIEANKGEAN